MTTITHTADGPRFDGMTVGELIAHLTNQSAHLMRVDLGAFTVDLDRAAAALRHLSEWQPIETVPHNVSVLIYVPHAEHYGPGIYRAIRVVGMSPSIDLPPRWHVTAVGMGRDIQDRDVTHWRPLPPGPDGGGA